jgi:hypothetical protein
MPYVLCDEDIVIKVGSYVESLAVYSRCRKYPSIASRESAQGSECDHGATSSMYISNSNATFV